MLTAFQGLPGWRLVLAPRHPQRFEAVAGLLAGRGLAFSRRSSPAGAWSILLLDAVGELGTAYAAADLAFVGGSLAPVGGHNVLEPARCGVGVLVGPHTGNFMAETEELLRAGGLLRSRDTAGLAAEAARLGGNETARKALGRGAKAAVMGTSSRALAEALGPFLAGS